MDVNSKGESRELLKKLADLMTISDLLNEDITFYKEKISEQEQLIALQEEQLIAEKQKISILLKEKEEIILKLRQEAKQERQDLEIQLKLSKEKLQQNESDFLQQVFTLETTNKYQVNKITDLESGRASLIKTIQYKEELFKRQSSHYEKKLTDTKLYWQTKLTERASELETQITENISQWEVKYKCLQNDLDIYKRSMQEQVDVLTFQMVAKDKDYDKLKEQFDRQGSDLQSKEHYFNTHKEEHDKQIINLEQQVIQLKELQIQFEQKINTQHYEFNKILQQFKDADSRIRREQQKYNQLQTQNQELQLFYNNESLALQKQIVEIKQLYSSAANYLKLEIQTQDPAQMILFTQEYLQVLIKQNQDLQLEVNHQENLNQTQNLEWKTKFNRMCQLNASSEKRASDLDKKLNELQLTVLKTSLQQSVDSQVKKQDLKIHHYGVHKLEDLQIFLSNLEKSEIYEQSKESLEQNSQTPPEEISACQEIQDKSSERSKSLTLSKQSSFNDSKSQVESIVQQQVVLESDKQEILEDDLVEVQESRKQSNEEVIQVPTPINTIEQQDQPIEQEYFTQQKTLLLMGSKETDDNLIGQPINHGNSNIEANNNNSEHIKVEEMNQLEVQINDSKDIEKEEQNEKQYSQLQELDSCCCLNNNSGTLTLKEYLDQEVMQNELKQKEKLAIEKSSPIQKNEGDFQFYKARNKLRMAKKRPKKPEMKLKLDTDLNQPSFLNCTPDTCVETTITKVSRSTQIQTEWQLNDTPNKTITQLPEPKQFEQKESVLISKYEGLQKEFGKLKAQFIELEQDKLRMTIIIDFLQKNQPIIKIKQEASTQINNDNELYEKIESLAEQIKIFETELQRMKQIENQLVEKEKETEDLKDLIANMSDQIYTYKFDSEKQNQTIKELNEQLIIAISLQTKQQTQQQCIVTVVHKDKIEKPSLTQQSKTVIVRKETKEKERASTPNRIDSTENLKLKVFQQDKLIRNLNNQIAKKEQLLQLKQNQNEQMSQIAQLQNINVEVADLRKQLENKQEQLGRCHTIIKYLEIELENYKSNYNIFNKPKQQNTERIVRHLQPSIPQVSMSLQNKLPTLQEDLNSTLSKSSYKKRQILTIIQKQLSLHQPTRQL